MFGPIRGPWAPDPSTGEIWQGWWGPNPPFHTPVFVLTHHARPPLEMQGGTTFHFVTDGPDSALHQAKAAAQSVGRVAGKNKMSASAAEHPSSASTCSPARSTKCT